MVRLNSMKRSNLTGDAVFTVVQQCYHTVGVHALANVLQFMLDPVGEKKRLEETYKLVIFKVGYNFLSEGLSPLLKFSDAIFGKFFLDRFHVTLSQ